MLIQTELLLLIISFLFFASILVSKTGSKLGVPVLLLFLSVGMLFGSDGLGIQFNNIHLAQTISTIALCIILFSGGLDTKFEEIKPVIAPGVSLATAGVFFTAVTSGLLIWVIMQKTFIGDQIGLLTCLLLASTMSSTDSASVFSILRSKGLRLKNNLRPTLELESGSNDPMAYILTITLISLIQQGGTPHYGMAVLNMFIQLTVGIICGYVIGKALVFLINRIKIDNVALYPILVFTSCIFIFSATYFLKGNSYLAVYIGGLVIGNAKFVHKRSTRNFFNALSWLGQLTMFLSLGLLVNPSELGAVAIPALCISAVMIFLTRPVSVFLSLLPFKKYSFKDKIFVSWVGLRGAVPIIFAILCKAENVPYANEIFNIVFFCTLASLIIQGTTLPLAAKWLGVSEQPKKSANQTDFDIDFPEEIKTATTVVTITEKTLASGKLLMDFAMPESTLVILIKRDEQYFVPTGRTLLKIKDKLLILSDNHEVLSETIHKIGLDDKTDDHESNSFGTEYIEFLRNNIPISIKGKNKKKF